MQLWDTLIHKMAILENQTLWNQDIGRPQNPLLVPKLEPLICADKR
jgi:hypothetical protein